MSVTEVVMPQMGADMKEGTVIRWLKAEGTEVNRGEIIAEIETDKANIEIEAFGAGVFRKQIAKEGDVVPVGTVIAVIAGADEDISKYEGGNGAAAAQKAPEAAQPAITEAAAPPEPKQTGGTPVETAPPQREPAPAAQATPSATAVAEPEARLRVSPVAKKIAEEKGLDLRTIQGSGPDGRIVRRDVENAQPAPAAAAAPAPAAAAAAASAPAYIPPARAPGVDTIEEIAPTRMRSAIARATQSSKQQVPHYYLAITIDMTEAIALLDRLNEKRDPKITINDIIILATSRTLAQHPKFNAYWQDDKIQRHSQVNIGIAVAMDDGLVAPAIMDTYSKGLAQISLEARDVARRARAGNLRPEEFTAATFNISNGGVFGITEIAPIITQPQVGVIGVGAAVDTPVVRDGEVVIRSIMHVTLAADHRATDGADGARFLQTLRQNLEQPGLMLL
jgi:pyruvate dehydrogenase E2 component (dihydrolipoamide acetyltransferase)